MEIIFVYVYCWFWDGFDSVYCFMFWKIKKKYGILLKIIKIMKEMYEELRCFVRYERLMLE